VRSCRPARRTATPGMGRRRPAGFRMLAVLGGLLACGLTLAASAHAVLVSSNPEDGSRVNTEPAAVRLRFDEPVGLIPADEQVISSQGRRADTGHPQLAAGGTTIVLPLRPGLPAGTYTAVWRVVSADTHVVSGSITFGLRVRPGAGVAAPASHTGQIDIAAGIARGLDYAGLVLLVGVAAAARLIWPWSLARRRVRVLGQAGWAALAAGTVAEFLLQGPMADNQSWAAVIGLHGAVQTAASLYGQELLARLVLLAVILAVAGVARALPERRPAWWRDGRGRDGLAAAAGLALLVSVAVTGHEAVGPGVGLALLSAVTHLAAMSLWIGGLVMLIAVVLPAMRTDPAAAWLPRWSATAYSCVVALVITGEYQAYRQVSPVQALWSTSYGLILLLKTAVVAVMLMAAALLHRHVAEVRRIPASAPESDDPVPLSPSLSSSAPTVTASAPATAPVLSRAGVRAVQRSVVIEVAAAVVVLGLTALLVSQPPARTTYGPAVTLTAPLGPDHVSIHVTPTRRGPELIDIRVLNAAGQPVPAQTVTATLSSPQVAALEVGLRRLAPDGSRWISTSAVLPLPGVWMLTMNIGLGPATAYATSASYRVW
jgi:copper transport protein